MSSQGSEIRDEMLDDARLEAFREFLLERDATIEDVTKTEMGNWVVYNRVEGLYEPLPSEFLPLV